jgi:peptidoglycan/xylan/chitin deacetylase (PgdA/CDA1 family)
LTEHVDIVCVYDNDDFSAPIEYTFALILSTLDVRYKVTSLRQFMQEGGYPNQPLLINYAHDPVDLGAEKQIHIYASDFFSENYLKPDSLPQTPLKKYNGLPVIYHGRGDYKAWVRKSEGLIETNIDIIASTFFMLSRYEEVMQDVKDQYERFPATASLAYREGFLDRPIVNEYIELLWGWIQSLQPGLERKPLWPSGRGFAVCLTHDVDSLQRYSLRPPIISIASAILRQENVRLGFNIAIDYLRTLFHLKKDPFDTFDYMLDLEQKYGYKSSFYFMADDSSYSLSKLMVRKLIQAIKNQDCEIGLHGSYNSYNDLEKLASEKRKLDMIVKEKGYGCRQHFLRFKTPDSWRFQEGAGLLYDATLSFADHAGFRCGFCLPFKPFDIIENRKLNIWELPLMVQEGTLQRAGYQNLPPEEAYKEMVELIQTTKECHGVFVLLWHNSSFDPLGGWAGWKEVYERLMEYIGEQNAWVSSGREIIEWWEARMKSTSLSFRDPILDYGETNFSRLNPSSNEQGMVDTP